MITGWWLESLAGFGVPPCARHIFHPLLLSGHRAWGPVQGAWGRVSHLQGRPPSVPGFCSPSSSPPSPRSCSHWLEQAAARTARTARTAWEDLVKLSSLGGPGPGPHPSSRASLSARSSCVRQTPLRSSWAAAAPPGRRQAAPLGGRHSPEGSPPAHTLRLLLPPSPLRSSAHAELPSPAGS